MIKRIFAIGGIALAACSVNAQSGASLQAAFSKALNSAQALSVNYTVQPLGGAPVEIKVELQKPNLARIERAFDIVVADGKNVTVFDKAAKTFYKKPQTAAELGSLFAGDDLKLWSPFFDEKAFATAPSKNLGVKNRKGTNYNTLELVTDAKSVRVLTLFLSQTDNLPRQAVVDLTAGKQTWIIDTKTFALSADAASFAFNAPAGAKEVDLASLNADKWYTDINEAMKVAKATGRVIFVDFMAEWCGPCKKLDAEVLQTARFKSLSKKAVFLRIDVDHQKDVSAKYKIEAMPTQMVLDKDGNVLSTTVGYGNADMFYAWLLPNLK